MCGLDELMDYTDRERGKWHDWFRRHGDHVLKISAGPMATVVLNARAIW
jgi:hypothetical protein